MSNTQLLVRDDDTNSTYYVEVEDTVDCSNMSTAFPKNPNAAVLNKLTAALPELSGGDVWKSLGCAIVDTGGDSKKIKAFFVKKIDGYKLLSLFADGTGVLKTTLVATGNTPTYPVTEGFKTMTTADGPYVAEELFSGTMPYAQLYKDVPNGSYFVRIIDEDGLYRTFDIIVNDTGPDAVLIAPPVSSQKATKITDSYIATNGDNSPFSLSVYARGMGDITVEVTAIEGTPAYSNGSKKMLTEAGGYTRSGLFNGVAPYGALFPDLVKGKYTVRMIDSSGGVDSYSLPIPATGMSLIVKGTADGVATPEIPGTGPITPTIEFLGNVRVDESQRPDLMNLVATAFRKTDGTWWFKVKDTATGNFQKSYRGLGRHYTSKAQVEAGEWPFGFPFAATCTEMTAPYTDDKLPGMDSKAHCVQKIFTS